MRGCVGFVVLSLAACGLPAGEHHHEHKPPHGGTLVVFGDGVAHLELVLDAQNGALTAYVLDGEAEKSLRVKQGEIELRVTAAGTQGRHLLVKLKAVANVLTGESEGDTSQFEGRTEALKGLARFSGVVAAFAARGREFRDVPFKFPEGNEAEPGKQ